MARYLSQPDIADRQTAAGEEASETVRLTKTRLKEKLAKFVEEVKRLASIEKVLLACIVRNAECGRKSISSSARVESIVEAEARDMRL